MYVRPRDFNHKSTMHSIDGVAPSQEKTETILIWLYHRLPSFLGVIIINFYNCIIPFCWSLNRKMHTLNWRVHANLNMTYLNMHSLILICACECDAALGQYCSSPQSILDPFILPCRHCALWCSHLDKWPRKVCRLSDSVPWPRTKCSLLNSVWVHRIEKPAFCLWSS